LVVWKIQLFGGLRLTHREQVVTAVNTNRLQALLAYLALHTGVLQSREHLAFLFWPDSTEAQARTNLRQLLHHLRSALPDGGRFIETESQTILWQATAEISIDVADFENAVSRAQKAVKNGDATAARREFEEAARLYNGDLMPGFLDEWAEQERNRLRQKCSDVLVQLIGLLEDVRDIATAIPYAEQLLSLDPFCETSYQTLMRLHAMNGDRAAALRVYHQCATQLRRELDTEPGPETKNLRDQVTKQSFAQVQSSNVVTKSADSHLPLVGRQDEFNRLLDAWKAADAGRASLALVTGESGIGKTRLAEELLTWASRRGVATAQAKCYAAEGRLAFASVADWIRSPVLHPVLASLAEPQLSELVRVLPELLVERPDLRVPTPLTEGWQRHHFFEALARAVLKGPRPLLLLIDDVQWSDQETLEWLHYLLRLEPEARLLVVGTARIEDLNDRHAVRALTRELNRYDCCVEIPLGFLSSKETAALAAQVSEKPLDPKSMLQLYSETEGHPLFVIESVRAKLLSASVAAGGEAQARQRAAQGDDRREAAIPPKVHAVLTARFAQLSTEAQELTSLAACIGRPFTAELLARASHSAEDELVSWLDELWQRRIIKLEGGASYDFTHDKLREVAYAELSPARRQLYHRRIAESILDLSKTQMDAVSAELALHYEHAALPARAVPLYYRAAGVSQRRYAESEAIAYLTRALELIEFSSQDAQRDQIELELLASLGRSLSATQGYAAPEVGRVYARARMLCESGERSDRDLYFAVLWGSWVYHGVRADLNVAREMASRLFQMSEGLNNSVIAAGAHFAMGCTFFHFGEINRSREHFLKAMPAEAVVGGSHQPLQLTAFGPEMGVFCLSYLAHISCLLGEVDQSLEYCRQSLVRAKQLEHPFSIALALDYASLFHQFRDEPSAAAEKAEESAALCSRYGFSYYLAWTLIIRGWSLAQTGAAHEGVDHIQTGLKTLAEQGAGLRGPYYQTLLAQAFASAGDVDQALTCLSEALLIREKTGECWSDPMIHRLRAVLLRKKGDVREANLSHQRALSLAKELKNR
jgi:DNA-binding SARP family transcriptional activator/predicted ATPase